MSPFDYSTTTLTEILVWTIDEHGFVQVELVDIK